jgi:uncharacterized delta-60 repeat protein
MPTGGLRDAWGAAMLSMLVVGCALVFSQGGVAAAAPGDLDRSFGSGGLVDVTPHPVASGYYSTIVGMAAGPEGEIFVLTEGRAMCASTFCSTFYVAKYSRNGALDASFGAAGGALEVPVGESVSFGIDREGRVVVASGGEKGLALTRFSRKGSLDGSFGNAGRVVVDQPLLVSQLAFEPDGAIVLAGRVRTSTNGVYPDGANLAVMRFRSDGSLDTGFGSSGMAVVDFKQMDRSGGLALVGGEIVVAVIAESKCCEKEDVKALLARFAADGKLVSTRGAWPRRRDIAERFGRENAVIPRHGRGIGVVGGTKDDTAISSFLADGRRESRFGTNGFAWIPGFTWGGVENAAEDAHGRLVVGGSVSGYGEYQNELARVAVIRRRSDGRVDRTFAAGHPRRIPVGGEKREETGRSLSVAVQPGGKIVVLGGWFPECSRVCLGSPSYSLARFLGGPSRARCRGQQATVVGTRRSETIAGTNHRDVIAGLGGDDTVFGRGGNDLICGGRGDDWLGGGRGRDRLLGGVGRDERRQ